MFKSLDKMLYCSFFLVLAAILLFPQATDCLTLREYYFDQPEFFDADSKNYLVENSKEFRDAAFGSLRFSIATWFNLAEYPDTQPFTLLHLTALDVAEPWDRSQYPDSVNHLANLARVDCVNKELHLYLGSFNTPDVDLKAKYDLLYKTWYFLYIGLDYLKGSYSYGLFSQSTSSWVSDDFTIKPANEALDNRLTLYLGSSKDKFQWSGSLYRTMFLVDFFTKTTGYAKRLWLGERRDMYYFFLDNVEAQSIIPSYEDLNTFILMESNTKSTSPSDNTNWPSANGVNGFQFNSALGSYFIMSLSNNFQEANFISFWVNLGPYTSDSTILSINDTTGAEFLSIVAQNNAPDVSKPQKLTVTIQGSPQTPSNPISLPGWHFVYLTFTYHVIDSVIKVNFTVDGLIPQEYTVNQSSPPDPIFKIRFGKTEAAGTSSFDGFLRNIIGGEGSHYTIEQDQETLMNDCSLAIGLEDPYCLLCKSGFTNPQGQCSPDCPSGTYRDTITNFCVPCDPNCQTCSGPGPSNCQSCPEDLPLLFRTTCYVACPPGTKKINGGRCDCDPSNGCTGCQYDSLTGLTQCVACPEDHYMLLDKSRCVTGPKCPLNTIGNPATKNCDTSCPSGQVWDLVNGVCSDKCPPEAFKKTSADNIDKCYKTCPIGTYTDSNTCVACPSNCIECSDANNCFSCDPPYLYHDVINKCLNGCESGFVFEEANFYCKACRENCDQCADKLFFNPQDKTCLEKCPIGMQDENGICVAIDGVDTQIVNKTDDNPVISVSRKENLVLEAKFTSSAQIQSYGWSLGSGQKSMEKDFFKDTDMNSAILVVPSSNLAPDTTYTIVFEVKDSLSRTKQDSIQIKTSSEIKLGTFTVIPENGIADDTEFQFIISGFSSSQNLKFDIITYSERIQYITEAGGSTIEKLIEPVDALSVALGVGQGTHNFTFPASDTARPVVAKLLIYNDDEQTSITKAIRLSPTSKNLSLKKVLVWQADTSTITDINKILEYVRAISLFYTRGYESKLINNYLRGELLLENLLIIKNLIPCSRVVECSSSGVCNMQGNTFTCGCETEVGGFNCYYGQRDFIKVSVRIRGVLSNLYSIDLTQDNVEQAILILNEVTNFMDFVERNTIFFFKDIVKKILNVPDLRTYHLRYIFSILGEVIEFVKRPLTSTWFKDVDRSFLLRNFTSLVETTISKIDGIRSTESYFIADTNFLKVLVINDVAKNLPVTEPLLSYSLEWEHFGFEIPQEVLNKLSRISVKILGYKVNPYTDVERTSQITSAMILEIYDATGNVKVEKLSQNIQIKIPKITATPIFEPKTQLSPYACQFKRFDEEFDASFSTDGCQFVEENDIQVICACNHLTGFVAQLEISNLASIPTSQDFMDTTNDFIEEELDRERKKRSYDNTNPVPIDNPVVVSKKIPFVRNYSFPNAGLYVSIGLGCLFLLSKLLNMKNLKKNSLKKFLEKGQSVLVVTYHPVLTLFITAHTAISNTQNMRLTKFFSMLASYAAFTGLFYYLLDLDLGLEAGGKAVIAGILTLFMSPGAVYSLEYLYEFYIKKYNKNRRRENLYHALHILFMIIYFGVTIATVGFIRSEFEGSWVLSFVVTMLFDLVILDFIVLIFAMIKDNNSKLLHLFRKKGYYVDTGRGSVITQEDIEELLRRAKGILSGDNKVNIEDMGKQDNIDEKDQDTIEEEGDQGRIEDWQRNPAKRAQRPLGGRGRRVLENIEVDQDELQGWRGPKKKQQHENREDNRPAWRP